MIKVFLKEIITNIESGSRPQGGIDKNLNSNIISLGAEHLNDNGNFKLANLKYIDNHHFKKMNNGIVENNDILIVKDGATTGKVSFFNNIFSDKLVTINEHVFLLRVNNNIVFPKYIFYFLFSPIGKQNILKDFRGATVGGISKKFIDKIQIPLPPLEEQKRIVDILGRADSLRQKRKAAIGLLDEFLRATFLDMFGDPVTNPKGWEVRKLGDLSNSFKYGTNNKSFQNNKDYKYPVLRIPNIGKDEINYNDLKYSNIELKEEKDLLLKDGDVLFVRSNGNPEYIGRCSIFKGNSKCIFASYLIRARLNIDANIDPGFIQFCLSFPTYRKKILTEARTTAGNYNINTERLKSLLLIYPPIELQNTFIILKEQLSMIIKRMNNSYQETESLFNSLMQKAFKGEK